MKKIDSINNPLIKKIKKLLNQKKERIKNNYFILEGFRSIEGAIRDNNDFIDVKEVLVSSEFDKRLPKLNSLETIEVNSNIFDKISDVKHHQGIMAIATIKKDITLNDNFKKILLLENINDPGNFGTLIRTAVASNYDAVIITGKCVDYTNPKVVRSSMGAICHIPIIECSLAEIRDFSKTSYCIISSVINDGTSIFDYTFNEKFILAIGSEAHGITQELLQITHDKVTIPINNNVESLNAAVAGSMMMLYSCKKSGGR